MTSANIAANIVEAIITGCLLSIVTFFLLGLAAAVVTVTRARKRERLRPRLLTELAHGTSVRDLAEIDDELELVLARER